MNGPSVLPIHGAVAPSRAPSFLIRWAVAPPPLPINQILACRPVTNSRRDLGKPPSKPKIALFSSSEMEMRELSSLNPGVLEAAGTWGKIVGFVSASVSVLFALAPSCLDNCTFGKAMPLCLLERLGKQTLCQRRWS